MDCAAPNALRISPPQTTSAPASKQYLIPRSRGPPLQHSFALFCPGDQLIERIDRGVKPQEPFKHRSEQEYAAADVLIFVKFDSRFDAAHKSGPGARACLSYVAATFDAVYAQDVSASRGRIHEVIEQ